MIIVIKEVNKMTVEKKYSRQREAIAKDLASRKDHPCADDVYESTRKIFPNISLGTVYRNLKGLSADGKIISFTVDGKEHFDGDTSNHCHFVCRNCHKIIDVFEPDFSDFSLEIQNRLECDADYTQIVLFGRCKACLEKIN